MHPACIEVLARQHLAELRGARTNGGVTGLVGFGRFIGLVGLVGLVGRLVGFVGGRAAAVRQRLGWVLVQVGLRLAVRQART